VQLRIWEPAKAQGVIIFSHGAGGSPDSYDALFESWKAAGFLVVAPLHTDSSQYPNLDRSILTRIADDGAAMVQYIKLMVTWAFHTRIADVAAAQAWAARAAPDLPYAYAGHSYGALIAMIRGGGPG
jgi:alpha-beta hydrolase superfamily lysophospholipase